MKKRSDAIGVVYEPRKIKQLAKAEVEADKIRALGKIKLSGIQERAMHRMIAEETIKQENIEKITAKAVNGLKDDSKPEDLERDWIANFFDKCRLVSDEEMQSLWSRLLAKEANKPGAFSKRTVELVANLDKQDAHFFTKLMGFGFKFGSFFPFIYDVHNEIYNGQGIKFETLSHLDSIGLVNFDAVNGYSFLDVEKPLNCHYFGTIINIEPPGSKRVELGVAFLTQAGKELAPVCGASSHPELLEYVFKIWKEKGYRYSLI